MLAKNGYVEPFTEFFVLAGYSDKVVQQGLEFFVGQWEDAVEWYVEKDGNELNEFGLVSVEFEVDLWCRSTLYVICQKYPEEN